MDEQTVVRVQQAELGQLEPARFDPSLEPRPACIKDEVVFDGLAEIRADGVEHCQEDKCIYGLTGDPDQSIWFSAGDHGGYDDISSAAIYVITPPTEAEGEPGE